MCVSFFYLFIYLWADFERLNYIIEVDTDLAQASNDYLCEFESK